MISLRPRGAGTVGAVGGCRDPDLSLGGSGDECMHPLDIPGFCEILLRLSITLD